MYRLFEDWTNNTLYVGHNLYNLEMYLHEALSQSEHRQELCTSVCMCTVHVRVRIRVSLRATTNMCGLEM